MASIKSYAVASGMRYRVFWNDPSGKKHGKVFKRLNDARSFRREIEHSLDRGSYSDPARGKITLEAFWESFIAAPPKPLSRSTRSLYRMLWRIHIGPRLGAKRLNAIEVEDVRGFWADLEEGGVQVPSINSAHRLLRRLLGAAVAEGRIPFNKAAGLQPPRVEDREMRFLTGAEVGRIANEVPSRYEALVWTLGYSGIRIGEAVALRVRNFDAMRRRLAIVEAATDVDGDWRTGPTKTRKKRSVVIPPELRDILVDHLERYGDPTDSESLVFTTDEGGPVRRHSFRRLFQRACKRAEVDDLRVHDLRHTAVAFAIASGAHTKMIQEMLGHSSVKTTMDIYGHVDTALHEEVAQRLDQMLRDARVEATHEARVSRLPRATAPREGEGAGITRRPRDRRHAK